LYRLVIVLLLCSFGAIAHSGVSGVVTDPQGHPVAGATVILGDQSTRSDSAGRYVLFDVNPESRVIRISKAGFAPLAQSITLDHDIDSTISLQFTQVAGQKDSIVITSTTTEPSIDLRNAEVFNRTLFTRDDQVFHQLNAGINAGQHEGGGKSLEIRRFGFNLDHGGVNGGLKVLVDGMQQNQGTQGHGQGYLGSLKSLSPELISEANMINGPFSAEYGDFSGLGVVHIRQRESLPDQYTVRLQGGNFNNGRGFIGFSPDAQRVDSYFAYEGSYTDGPFQNPGRYRRDNINANFTKALSARQKLGFRARFGRNNFYSSGQLPLDLVADGTLDRFGFIDDTLGGRVKSGTLSTYYSRDLANAGTFKVDGFVSRSLFDLFSNFTFFLNDPVLGDAIQQHDSRLEQGANSQYSRTHRIGGTAAAIFTAGGNLHASQINVGLYPRLSREPIGVSTKANAKITNGAGYAQESLSFWNGKFLLTGGLRFDEFRYDLADRVESEKSGVYRAGRWQGKGAIAFTPSQKVPLTLHLNYGRGINSVDARGVVQRPELPRLATTDFYQAGFSSHHGRVSMSGNVFLIDHSNEQVYIPDDGSFEFKGPTRSYGFEGKTSLQLTRRISLNGGLTKVSNAFYRGGGDCRIYVDSAPHFVASAALTMSSWRGWGGSIRMRSINHYRLDGEDPSILAAGHTVFDIGVSKRVQKNIEFNVTLDNAGNRSYYETQNYFESRVAPGAPVVSRIHATPGYPLTVVAGLTFRFRGK
jgi:hypothetical protein